jgi:zinc protease
MALWLEADRMGFLLPAMTKDKLDNQRDVVKNERRQTVDNRPYGTWLENILKYSYPDNFPYHWPIIGYMDDLDKASLDDISNFFSTYYSPANASLCVAGDFDEDNARLWIEKYFGPIQGITNVPKMEDSFNGSFKGEIRKEIKENIQLPRIYMAYHIPAFGAKEWYELDFFSDVISSGKSSRLYREMVHKKQLVSDVFAFTFGMEGTSLLMFVATAQNGVDIGKVEQELQNEIEDILGNGIAEQDIQRMKNQIEAHKVRELQSVTHIADSLNSGAVHFNDPGYINRELNIYDSIKSKDMLDTANTFIKNNNRVVLTYLPE